MSDLQLSLVQVHTFVQVLVRLQHLGSMLRFCFICAIMHIGEDLVFNDENNLPQTDNFSSLFSENPDTVNKIPNLIKIESKVDFSQRRLAITARNRSNSDFSHSEAHPS